MGIPRLITYLEPYATPAELGGCKVIIDGPGLAYHIYYRLLSAKSRADNAILGAPSYAELGESTILFLDELQTRNVTVDTLYFDGFLPTAKETVRVVRLESYLKRLRAYKSTHPGPFKGREYASTPKPMDVSNLFQDASPVPTHLSSLPAPPFLVPAVIEALTHSHYGIITKVVPGEADEFCAARARAYGGVVLSSDSDLLVADLGSDGSVSLFRDLYLETEDGSKTVRTAIFEPRSISAKLGLPDLLGLAFELTKDGSLSLPKAIRRAKLLTQTVAENFSYQDFLRSYGTANASEYNSKQHSENEGESQPVDPRVSELLLQYRSFALEEGVGTKPKDSILEAKIYLPFLLDDPARASAWVISLSLRMIGYSLLNLTTDSIENPTIIAEYGRSGQRIMPKYLSLLTRDECSTHCIALTGRLEKARTSFRSATNSDFWSLYGLYELCRWYRENNKPLPCQEVMQRVMVGGSQNKAISNWDDIHLSMQLQGVLYSLRINQQVIRYLREVTVLEPTDQSRELLRGQLSELPPLREIVPTQSQGSVEQQLDYSWVETMNTISDLVEAEFGGSEQVTGDSQSTGKAEQSEVDYSRSEASTQHQARSAQKKRKHRTVDGISAKRKTSNQLENMYTVLNRD